MKLKNNRQERVKKLINKEFSPTYLEIKDNSHMHAGHGNVKEGDTETHLYLKIRTEKFKNLNKLQMHRLVYGIINEEFTKGLHAVELDLGS